MAKEKDKKIEAKDIWIIVASIKKIRSIKVVMIIILLVGLLSFYIVHKTSDNIIPFAKANYATKY